MKINMKGFDRTRTFAFLMCAVPWVIASYIWPTVYGVLDDKILGVFIGLFMHWAFNSKYRLSK